MVKFNFSETLADKEQLNQKWNELMANVNQGILDRRQAIYLMQRINCVDEFLIAQGIL